MINLLKSKIHRAVVTQSNVNYVGSIEKPFATLSKALKLVQPGDNIYLRAVWKGSLVGQTAPLSGRRGND